MKTTIKPTRIEIREMNESWERYFLATSKDISWFLAEWNTLDEIYANIWKVLKMLLNERNKRLKKPDQKVSTVLNLSMNAHF